MRPVGLLLRFSEVGTRRHLQHTCFAVFRSEASFSEVVIVSRSVRAPKENTRVRRCCTTVCRSLRLELEFSSTPRSQVGVAGSGCCAKVFRVQGCYNLSMLEGIGMAFSFRVCVCVSVCVCVQQVRQRGQDCKDSHALQQKQGQKAAEPQAKMPKPNSKSLQHPMEVISAFLLIRVWCLVCFVMVVKGRFWEGSAGLPCPTPARNSGVGCFCSRTTATISIQTPTDVCRGSNNHQHYSLQ